MGSSARLSTSAFLARVREGIARLAALDTERRVFAAWSHGYAFQDAIEDGELERFEREHGIRLPADYRAFLLELGNGGAGPSYGIFPLRGGDDEDFTDYEQLSQPFAYQEAFNPAELIHDEDDGSEQYWQAFDLRGALYICHHGCAARSLLIVSGEARGQIWRDDIADEFGIAPELDAAGEPMSFATWYLRWLEQALAGLDADAS